MDGEDVEEVEGECKLTFQVTQLVFQVAQLAFQVTQLAFQVTQLWKNPTGIG